MKRYLGLFLIGLMATSARAEQPDVAELFPTQTLAYVEIARPDRVAPALKTLFAGTSFADVLKQSHDKYDKLVEVDKAGQLRMEALFSLLLAPEMLEESGKLGGVGLGWLGYTPEHTPSIALAVQLGQSNAIKLAARAFLTSSPEIRRAGIIDGVPVYQHRGFVGTVFGPDGKPVPPTEEEKKHGNVEIAPGVWTYALVPGLFIAGSDPSAVKSILAQHTKRSKENSLAGTPTVTRLAAQRESANLWYFARPDEIARQTDSALKERAEALDSNPYAALKFLADFKTMPMISGSLTIVGDRIDFVSDLQVVDPQRTNKTIQLLATEPRELVRPLAIDDVLWSGSLALTAQEQRSERILAWLDALAKSAGVLGALPSERIATLDDKSPAKVSELLSVINAVQVIVPAKVDLPKDATAYPFLILSLDKSIPDVEGRLTRLITALVGTDTPAFSSEQINGVKVTSVTGPGILGKAPWHFAVADRRVVVGQDRKRLVTLINLPMKPTPRPGEVGTVHHGRFVPAQWAALWTPKTTSPMLPGGVVPGRLPQFIPPGGVVPIAPPAIDLPLPGGDPTAVGENWLPGLGRFLKPIPAQDYTVVRTSTGLRLTWQWSNPSKPLAAGLEGCIEWLTSQHFVVRDPLLWRRED